MSNTTSNQPAKSPVERIRIGFVHGAIWANETEKGIFYAFTHERRYKDSYGKYKSTQRYSFGDLLALSKLADNAHTKMAELMARDKAAALEDVAADIAEYDEE
jgi:hypothetical protein